MVENAAPELRLLCDEYEQCLKTYCPKKGLEFRFHIMYRQLYWLARRKLEIEESYRGDNG